jgi:hypothetical protein
MFFGHARESGHPVTQTFVIEMAVLAGSPG